MAKPVAFLFPGQGSQVVGMGADVYATSEAARNVFQAFDEALGSSLSEICFHGPEDILRSTINAQPAIVAVSLAYLAAFQEALSAEITAQEPRHDQAILPTHSDARERGSVHKSRRTARNGEGGSRETIGDFSWVWPLMPSYVAGHSVGEGTALVPAEVASLQEVARFVRERGRLMHEAETACPGGMAAIIGMDEQTLQEIFHLATQQMNPKNVVESPDSSLHRDPISSRPLGLTTDSAIVPQQTAGEVVIANYNAPGQIVISGEQQALEAAMALAKERGAARVIPLPVSGAFHSPVMAPAADQLTHFLAEMDIHRALIPIISNITGTPLSEAADLRQELGQQVAASVQWVRTIEYLTSVGISIFFEIGPGRALAGMGKRIAREATIINIGSVADIEKAAAFVRDHDII